MYLRTLPAEAQRKQQCQQHKWHAEGDRGMASTGGAASAIGRSDSACAIESAIIAIDSLPIYTDADGVADGAISAGATRPAAAIAAT